MVASEGAWRNALPAPLDKRPPTSLLARVADGVRPLQEAGWQAWPLLDTHWPTAVLALKSQAPHPDFDPTGPLGEAVRTGQRLASAERRALRLQALLELVTRWHQTLDMHRLLADMAAASTRLLAAERATIFLWDRRTQKLVGRPALGVTDGELRIPDDLGVVGRVVQTGEPLRVGRDDSQGEISHVVDRQLQFQTRNLVCVPLISRRGRVLGAFEVLNRQQGDFTQEDQAELAELAVHAAAAIENCRGIRELVNQHKADSRNSEDVQTSLIGSSPPIQQLRERISRVANSDLPVLLLGENGTGKEIASRMIHDLSARREGPFLAINCAAVSETLLASELFGHEKGAFTDAHETRPGKFELAAKGTLFLDEIGELPLACQAQLLRAVEEKVVVRVGGSTTLSTNARLLAATNRDLGAMVRAGTFREDLFFRLNVVMLEMPPLRERPEDIPELADHFLSQFCASAHRALPELSKSALQRMRAHAWPGNVRELRNLMERIAYLVPDDIVTADDLPLAIDASRVDPVASLKKATRQFQIDTIERHIQMAAGNMTEAAASLGLHRSNLYRKMSQLGMSLSAQQGEDE